MPMPVTGCLCPVTVTGCLCPVPVPYACALRHRIPEVPYGTVRVLCWDNLNNLCSFTQDKMDP